MEREKNNEWRQLSNILFLDIETVSCKEEYKMLDPRIMAQWDRKATFLPNEAALTNDELFFNRAGIYAEFGKIVAIAVGYFHKNSANEIILRVKSFYAHDEKELLTDFVNLLDHFENDVKLCAHNGKEFDFPYLCRRLLINSIKLPGVLDLSGKKPWEVNHLDTMNMWKFGDWKNYTSLDLMAAVLNVESSKQDMDGSMVNHAYYKEDGLERISEYCQRDVAVTARVYLKLQGMEDIPTSNVIFV